MNGWFIYTLIALLVESVLDLIAVLATAKTVKDIFTEGKNGLGFAAAALMWVSCKYSLYMLIPVAAFTSFEIIVGTVCLREGKLRGTRQAGGIIVILAITELIALVIGLIQTSIG